LSRKHRNALNSAVPEPAPQPLMLNALTVDVEDYFQVSGFERHIRREEWLSYSSRVVANTQRMLAILDRHNVKATFFVLGWVAERFPGLIRDIDAAGHETGSHSYWHRLVYEQSAAQFRDDLRRSQGAIEQAIGKRAAAYRAPSFSITRRSLWALDILVEEGFTVDSSVFPIRHDRYGIAAARREPHVIDTPAGSIVEFPPSVARWGKVNIPISGGGYFRLAPYRVTAGLLARLNARTQRPFMFYIHPWEIDPDQPRLPAGSLQSRFRHYVNLSSTAAKLERLLARFSFGTISESLRQYAESRADRPLRERWTGDRHEERPCQEMASSSLVAADDYASGR
jgi:polysaccharide deacetylase family protein (PEP-CTERM system associated)